MGEDTMLFRPNSKCQDCPSGSCEIHGYVHQLDVFVQSVLWSGDISVVSSSCLLHCCFFFPSHHSRTGRPCRLAAVPTALTPGRFRYTSYTCFFHIWTATNSHSCYVHLVLFCTVTGMRPLVFFLSFQWQSLVCFERQFIGVTRHVGKMNSSKSSHPRAGNKWNNVLEWSTLACSIPLNIVTSTDEDFL